MEENKQPNPEFEERDATLDDEPTPAMTADELQDSILEDSDMTAFQKYCARMSDKRWALAQRIVGALLGVIAGVSLFWDTITKSEGAGQGNFFSVPLVIAIVIALAVPNIIERKSARSIPKLRIAMVVSLALVIVIYFIVIGAQTGFKFTT